jgi:hypothetical protein
LAGSLSVRQSSAGTAPPSPWTAARDANLRLRQARRYGRCSVCHGRSCRQAPLRRGRRSPGQRSSHVDAYRRPAKPAPHPLRRLKEQSNSQPKQSTICWTPTLQLRKWPTENAGCSKGRRNFAKCASIRKSDPPLGKDWAENEGGSPCPTR